MAVQQQQIIQPQQPQQPAWQPTYTSEQTRRLISSYQESPVKFKEEDLENIRQHAQYHNLPFYEGEFSIFDALKQAGGGFIEGFTTLRVAEPPDNEYEAVARNLGHLAGFVPGILSGPLKALGLMKASVAVKGIKSIPMLGADYITKGAKKIVTPALRGTIGSRWKAADTASNFFLGEKAAHVAEGAFHLGAASAISSVWDGVDQMMHSFVGGAGAGAAFRVLGNIVPGTTAGDKAIKGLAGSLFMGLPATARGATTPEQIYEYLAGAYFGSNELPWFHAKANKGMQEFVKAAEKDPKLEWSRDVEKWEGFDKYPEIVQNKIKDLVKTQFGERDTNLKRAYELMERFGITNKIPAEDLDTKGLKLLNDVIKGQQKQTDYTAHEAFGVGMSGAAPGADAIWSKVLNKYGFPVIHYIPAAEGRSRAFKRFEKLRNEGKLKGVGVTLSDSELMLAGPAVEKANITLDRNISQMSRQGYEYVLRNWFQVRNAESLYAVAPIETQGKNAGREVQGGTGWAVQMGIDKGMKDVFVYDPFQSSWFQWNPGGNRFQAINGTPKLKANPALIGSRPGKHLPKNFNKIATKVIKDVAEVTFGELKTGKKSPVKGAVDQKNIKQYHVKNIKEINEARELIARHEKGISEINKALSEDKPDRVRVKELKKERKKLAGYIEKLKNEIKFKKDLEPTQFWDEVSQEVVNDIDTGMSADVTPLMAKSENFSRTHLKELWDVDSGLLSKRDKMVEVGKQVQTILKDHVIKKDTELSTFDGMRVAIEEALKIQLKPEAVGDLRMWLREQNLGQQVIFLKTAGPDRKGIPKVDFTNPNRPTTDSGKAISQIEPIKPIEEVYWREGGKLKKGAAPLVVFSSMTKEGKHGFGIDVPLEKLENHIMFSGKLVGDTPSESYKREVGSVIRDVLESRNLYPISGQGDKGRIVFAKFHPKTKIQTESKYNEILSILGLKARKNLEKEMKRFYDDYIIDKAVMTRATFEKHFKKMIVSNMLYDLSLNGYNFSVPNMKIITGKGFIPGAIGFNKRSQIWMTNGYSANREFFKNKGLGLSEKGFLNYRIIEDPETPDKLKDRVLELMSTELPEHVDGAILVRDDVIKVLNEDAGHPVSGQNKSFIIDNTPNAKGENMGALLGKYMMHGVGEKATAEMKAADVHMLVMGSAAKQTGLRNSGDYTIEKGLEFQRGETYELDPASIRYNSSVINDSHMTQKQIWVKQLFTNLHKYGKSEISKDIIDDINNDIVKKSLEGNPEVNKVVEEYKKTFDSKKMEYLIQNIEEMGTKELLELLKTPGAERFSEKAMQEMLKIAKEDINAQHREGELTAADRATMLSQLAEAVSPIDRLLRQVAIVGEEAAAVGKSGYSGYLHKFVRDYRQAVLQKYFVKRVTRPKVDNSAVARIRPYDKWLQKDFPDLNKDDNSFYLDNAYTNTRIKLPNGKTKTLGEIWNSPELRKEHSDVFDAIVLRVPMDSLSGAHKLRFKGFTNIDGHGILMHSRTMRAIGGADLDGDEAFVYFGGRKKDGSGGGMKKSWMDAIHANRGEFYNKEGTNVTNNKTEKIKVGPFKGLTYKELLTKVTGEVSAKELKEDKTFYYSPYSRLEASKGAIDGRNMLGIAVIQSQIMKSLYSALMEAPGKKDSWIVENVGKSATSEGDTIRFTITPKTSNADRLYQRELTRAQIAFASDPLDEAGLKSSMSFFNTLHNAYFNVKTERQSKVSKRWTEIDFKLSDFKGEFSAKASYDFNSPDGKVVEINRFIPPWMLKQGMYKYLSNMNRAYFSKNYEEGRNFSMNEINRLGSDIRFFTEAQKNTMLPKLVDSLHGMDWSDNLFNRIGRQQIKDTYGKIDEIVLDKKGRFGNWLKEAMQRTSFRVAYNKHIDSVMSNELYDPIIRNTIAKDGSASGLEKFRKIIKNSVFGHEFKEPLKDEKTLKDFRNIYSKEERLKALEEMHSQSEDFLANDIATMSTILNIKRILDNNKISPEKIAKIHRKVEMLKARSYLNRKERRQLDYEAVLEDPELAEISRALERIFDVQREQDFKRLGIKGDIRSASYDQAELDMKIREYKGKLNEAEKELFDHLMLGTLRRGDLNKVRTYYNRLPKVKKTAAVRDILTRLIKESAKTTQSRLAINSEAIDSKSIQNHLREMNDIHVDMWRPLSKEKTNEIYENASKVVEEVKPTEPKIVDDLVQKSHKGEGYAGIKKGELKQEDKKLISDIAVLLKKYNSKLEGNIPDLNQQIRGITAALDPDMRGKDLNALHKQDFIRIRDYLQELENGTIWQRIWGKGDKPEIMKRYYNLFPETISRELMAHDIVWLKKQGHFIKKGGELGEGIIKYPTTFLNLLQDVVYRSNNLANAKSEKLAKEVEDLFNNLSELKEGNGLFKIAVSQMELGYKEVIDKFEQHESLKKAWKLNYDINRAEVEKEFNWKKLKDKSFTVLNDANQRVTATGSEIVNGSKAKNLSGIKEKVSSKFKEWHKMIVGDANVFKKYQTGKYFDNDPDGKTYRTQPKMNWTQFVKDINKKLQKGDDIGIEIGIDGMRHVMRSMMADLGGKKNTYHTWILEPTKEAPYGSYWPHMFHDKRAAMESVKRTLELIRNDSTLTKEQKQKAIEKVAIRHKTVTGDWEFQDMQDWDKIDVFEMQGGLERIASKKAKDKDTVKWTDMSPTFGSMRSRASHIPGWSLDMNVMQVYGKNLVNTYYRQVSHLFSRKILDNAFKKNQKKYGKDLAKSWDRFYKLYVQGAMGQPDVIPEDWYNDSSLKLKGTPFAWWADNNVLKRVNSIRESLGIKKSEMPKELEEFTYQDLRNWSNMEAKFELASLLSHPKTAITNIFGGSLHTIQSAGPGALKKARDIKYLKRINPKWNSLQDVEDFVVSKGVVPEFMIHELGLGKEAKGMVGIEKFIGDLSSKINSKDPIQRKEIITLGKKHGISDSIVAKASKFMSIPERVLRRDAFMAHYVRAWERFGGAIKDPNHPFLIETAKKGVKATQFLYEAPFRPFFARTALGKIMSRFQLYAWNSVRFRNDVIRQAKLYGFMPGTEAYNKFTRTMQIDLFVLALANMFAYSLFDTALPQPYSWFQDTAEWLFGDEREREKAFFGAYPKAIAPLQAITPPLARFPVSGLMQWARDDYTKFTDYQIYTLFPFGRMVRDIAQPESGLIDNPSRILEKMAGLPVRDVQRFATERKKDLEEGKRYKQVKPGVF